MTSEHLQSWQEIHSKDRPRFSEIDLKVSEGRLKAFEPSPSRLFTNGKGKKATPPPSPSHHGGDVGMLVRPKISIYQQF